MLRGASENEYKKCYESRRREGLREVMFVFYIPSSHTIFRVVIHERPPQYLVGNYEENQAGL